MRTALSIVLAFVVCAPAAGQAGEKKKEPPPGDVLILGRVLIPRIPEEMRNLPPNTGIIQDYFSPKLPPLPPGIEPLANVRVFASLDGPQSGTMASGTWEMHPTGWYHLAGPAGRYTMVYTGPSMFVRPTVVTNVFAAPGARLDRKVVPPFEFVAMHLGAWDSKPVHAYYQTFKAKGTGITSVGFRLVHDGVDGQGPGSQDLVLSVHRAGPGTPDTWEQVGVSLPVYGVDSGGAKNYLWTAAWNSGEIVTKPGETYAVRLKAQKPDGRFQAFWLPGKSPTPVFRLGADGKKEYADARIWMYAAGDGDGLVIPYNKRVQKEYANLSSFGRIWSQTYVAQGRGLAAVLLYAATGGTQPSIARQRLLVRVREGGPKGPVVGVEKLSIGNGVYTGDAAWGTFGAVYSPGEVLLVPGKTYALEFESVENYASLHGFTDIKSRLSDDRPGFNPYTKHAPDQYAHGTAYLRRTEEKDFDLDMQIIEYEHAAKDWHLAVHPENLLANGDMEKGECEERDPRGSRAAAWKPYAVDSGTVHQYLAPGPRHDNRILRVVGGHNGRMQVDGGFVQKVVGVSALETYRLYGQVRCTWRIDDKHACHVGVDPTGQETDPDAETIVWSVLPKTHSIWNNHLGDPVRPRGDSISVWLRARDVAGVDFPFRADFDNFALRRVRTDVPSGN